MKKQIKATAKAKRLIAAKTAMPIKKSARRLAIY